MANTSGTSDPSGDDIGVVGSPFALGEWLARRDEEGFAGRWREWCASCGISSEDDPARAAVAVAAVGGKLVFTHPSGGALELAVEGDALSQAYALLTQARRHDPPLPPERFRSPLVLPAPERVPAGLPHAEPERVVLPTRAAAPPPPPLYTPRVTRPTPAPRTQTHRAPVPQTQPLVARPLPAPSAPASALPAQTSSKAIPLPKEIPSAEKNIPLPEETPLPIKTSLPISIKTSLPAETLLSTKAPLPEEIPLSIKTSLPKESALPIKIPLPAEAPSADKIPLPEAVPPSNPAAPASDARAPEKLPLPEEAAPAGAPLPATPTRADALPTTPHVDPAAPLPAPQIKAPSALPAPETRAASAPLPIAETHPAAPLPTVETQAASALPTPGARAATDARLPEPERAAERAGVGRYLLPLEPLWKGARSDATVAESLKRLSGDITSPTAVADVLGQLKLRRAFVVLSPQFNGLVLEVEMADPFKAVARLSAAKAGRFWSLGGEVIVERDGKAPLVFSLEVGKGSDSKFLLMAHRGTVNLVEDLFRPVFGDIYVPEGFGLEVSNPVLVLVKEGGRTKALVNVGLGMNVEFAELPFLGTAVQPQGDARIALGVQYASGPFLPNDLAALNSSLPEGVRLASPDGETFDGLLLSAAVRMAGQSYPLSFPLRRGDDAKKEADGAKRETEVAARTAGSERQPAAPDRKAEPDKTIKWIKVDRSAGPAYLDSVGIGFWDKAVQFRVSGSVQMSGLTFGVEGLGGGLTLEWPPKPTFNLDGLAVSLVTDAVSISGVLIRSTEGGVERYDGAALIKASGFAIAGLGSYSEVGGRPSLFIFAVLHRDLGGPAFFHVNGLAAGFGYNRAFKLPPVEEVQNFPLVRGALEENYFAGSTPKQSIAGAMQKLREYIPPSPGDYWFAAGIRFSSFEMIQSFALLSVSFGHEVEIALLGMSKLTVPKDAGRGRALAYAELAIKAVVKPEEGLVAVEGRLTHESYVFSEDCHLTGGFAFYTWLSGAHAGDFVVTLGGYHPKFVRPAHYPAVPRLGVNWQVTSELKITAELYYALTPSCLMAGGKLSATYLAGPIKAWFTAYADFLLSWKPFYYMADMGISIGVEATLRIPLGFCTISISINVHLSVELHIWGPAFAGVIEVDLSVITFTIRFGPDKSPPPPIEADEFVETFLPPPPAPVRNVVRSSGAPVLRGARRAPAAAGPEVISTRINSGLIRQENRDGGKVLRVVHAHALTLTTQSLIPVSEFSDGLKPPQESASSAAQLGVRPMGKTSLNSALKVAVKTGPDATDIRQPDNMRVSVVETGVPEALWGRSEVEGRAPLPSTPEAGTITAWGGLRVSFAPVAPAGALPPMAIEKFAYETFYKPIPWDTALRPAASLPAESVRPVGTIMGGEAAQRRDAVLGVLALESPFALNEVKLEELAKAGESYFQADPEIRRLGEAFV